MDIESQRLTIAIKPEESLDLKVIYKAILDGGYEPQNANMSGDDGVVTYFDAKGLQCIASC